MESNLIYRKSFDFGVFATFSSQPSFEYIEVNQVHGVEILQAKEMNSLQVADGLFYHSTGPQIMAIKTADCIPLLVIGQKGVALLHAGWKGVRDEIFNQPILEQILPDLFFFGPSIQAENYEVQRNFHDEFPDSPYFLEQGSKMVFDIPSEAARKIKLKWHQAKIEQSRVCTFENAPFHSFRRNKTQQRNWNVFIPKDYSVEYDKAMSMKCEEK